MIRTIGKRRSSRGLRPLDVGRDLRGVATLLDQVFGQGMEMGIGQVAGDLRLMSYLSPLFWALERALPNAGKLLYGYVWVEDGRIVGNVTIGKVAQRRGLWAISNVAVHPDYRRRSIGRGMLEAAMELIKTRGGETVVLEAERQNIAAQELYRSLGFTKVGGMADLRLAKIGQGSASPGGGLYWKKLGAAEGREGYALAEAAIPLKLQRLRPLRRRQFQASLWERVAGWIGDQAAGRDVHRLGLKEGGKLVALLNVYALRSYGGRHRLEFFIHPDYEGRVDETLVGKGLSILQRYPAKGVTISLPLSQSAARAALKGYGFREVRALEQLELRLS